MTPWTAAHQAPPSMGFSRQEYWSGVPSPSPGWSHNEDLNYSWASQVKLVVKNLPASAGDLSDVDLIPGWGRSPGEGNSKPLQYSWASQVALVVKNLPASAGDLRDMSLIPALGRSPGGGNGNPPQYSCLENPMDRGAWWATVHGVTKSRT